MESRQRAVPGGAGLCLCLGLAVCWLLLLQTGGAAGAVVHCPQGFLSCANGECIRQGKFCDGQQDCRDNSDEKDCDTKCHPPNFFRCHNGVCLSSFFVCDGENECGDGSDELDCENKTLSATANCSKDEFRCTDNLCIPDRWKCDGERDCLDGSDETIGCTHQDMCKEPGLFLCANHHCIPNEWHCDGSDDCGDNSDEQGCHHGGAEGPSATTCPLERGLYPCRSHTACIELAELCDGTAQCLDGSDEGPGCNASKTLCSSFGCSHRCLPTPSEPLCTCPKGFLLTNNKFCKDINECEEYGICSQKCNNLPGKYECACAPNYELQADNKSCKAIGPEALLVFSTKTEVRALFLSSKVYFSVDKEQSHVAGVAYDGRYMYWTSLVNGEESILRSSEDGSNKEVIVTSGLSLPEDLAIDWLTDNIYFTDSEEKHIGVCTTNGSVCTVLVNEDIDSPRAISLNIIQGLMFWTDWGKRPMIARAGMDGSNPIAFVSNNIRWPNGLTLDLGNERLYWVDAKLEIIESIKFDGTDRRIVLKGVVKHPYALAVFEDTLYWSDFKTSEILSCNKFTGKEQKKLIHSRKNYIYGLNIYHPSMHPEIISPCRTAECSDICLLAPNRTYTCACPENKILNEDKHNCRHVERQQEMVIAGGHTIVELTHQSLGRQEITATTLSTVYEIGALAYNNLDGTIFISDIGRKQIVVMNLATYKLKPLITSGIGTIEGLDFDYFSNNLYWCDSENQAVEVFSIATFQHKILLRTKSEEAPIDIVVIPEEGVFFVALRGRHHCHIDKMHMDGSGGLTHVVEQNLQGPIISLAYDSQMKRVFFADSGRATIESTDVEGLDRHGYQSYTYSPTNIATQGRDLFWTALEGTHLHWGNKFSSTPKIKRKELSMFDEVDRIVLQGLPGVLSKPSSPCLTRNGGCSHLCLVSMKTVVCACPDDFVLSFDNETCITPAHCAANQFKCEHENRCIPNVLRCDSKVDCSMGEDEHNCPKPCQSGEFSCANGQCVLLAQRCDGNQQCTDGSDEFNCLTETCTSDQFHCKSGECISKAWRCDMRADCKDRSDEDDCHEATCSASRFRCKSGTCIPASWECDGELNCADGSDEHDKCPSRGCLSDEFRCANGRCVDSDLRCDGNDDCADRSDELGCGAREKLPVICKEDQFRCVLDTEMCLPNGARCNGSAECPKGEDELGCGCSAHQFECDSSRCVERSWLCDGMKDCDDGSDEDPRTCGHVTQEPAGPCTGFRCRSGQCLDLSKACDGERQCSDGSDEGGKCNTACSEGHPCAGVCHPTPSGPRCSCLPGYSMKEKSTECVDVDECELNLCAQQCTNTPGSYSCGCVAGYDLRLDRHSCKAEGDLMQVIFVANGNEVRMAPYSLQSLRLLHQGAGQRIVGLDVDARSGTVYWSSGAGGAIFYRSLDQRDTRNVTGLGRPGDIALDWVTGNVYFADDSVADEAWIKVCNFDARKCAKLIKAESGSEIDDLAIDPMAGFLFWTEVNFAMFNDPHTVIMRTEVSGAGATKLLSGLSLVSGLTLDPVRRWIFWADHRQDVVGAIGYHGERRHIEFTKEVKKPFGLALFEDSLYWVSSDSGRLVKCRVFGQPRHCSWVQLNTRNVEHFTILQEQRQPPGENLCLELDCPFLCVSGAKDPKCLCPDGSIETAKNKCQNLTSDLQPVFPDNTAQAQQTASSSHAGAVIAILIIIAVAIGGGYILYRRKFNRSAADIRVKFINPIKMFKKDPSEGHHKLESERVLESEEEMESMEDPLGRQTQPPVPARKMQPPFTPIKSYWPQKKSDSLLQSQQPGHETQEDTAQLIP